MGKQVIYGTESRAAILRGVNQLADTVKITLGPRATSDYDYEKLQVMISEIPEFAKAQALPSAEMGY
jgi:hypothetical protein